jgi:archaellum component FlaC
VGTLKSDVGTLKSDVNTLKTDVKVLGEKVETIFEQTATLTEYRVETISKLDAIMEDQQSVHEVLGHHEVRIRTLIRKPV